MKKKEGKSQRSSDWLRAKFHYIHARIAGTSLLNLLIPLPRPLDPKQLQQRSDLERKEISLVQRHTKSADLETLEKTVASLEALVKAEDDRRQSIDSRLGTIIGLTSIAATLATGILVAQAAQSLKIPEGVAKWLLTACAFYAVAQLCFAIISAFRGQARKSFIKSGTEDLFPDPALTPKGALIERANSLIKQLQFNREQVNSKVSSMAIAHRACLNFAYSLLALCSLSVYQIATSPPQLTPSGNAPDVQIIRVLTTGPAGPAGPAGPVGPTGPAGPPGLSPPPVRVTRPHRHSKSK